MRRPFNNDRAFGRFVGLYVIKTCIKRDIMGICRGILTVLFREDSTMTPSTRGTGCATGCVTPTRVRDGMRYGMRDGFSTHKLATRTNAPLVQDRAPSPGWP